jgi:hypothetical protein
VKIEEFHLSILFGEGWNPAQVINAGLAQADDLNVIVF